MRSSHTEQSTDKTLFLVILFEYFLTETTLFSGKVKNFLIIILSIEIMSKHTGNIMSAATQLSSYIDNNVFIFHKL